MKITAIEPLHADGGWRTFDYLKISTDAGIVGWSEFAEGFGGGGISALISRLAPALIGKDPRAYEANVVLLRTMRRVAAGGAMHQAIAAIENALIDITARALGVPVYALFGGPVRDRIRVYWSHCGNYRFGGRAEMMGLPPVRTLDDLVALGREVVARGYTGLKINPLIFDDGPVRGHVPAFVPGPGYPDLNPDRRVTRNMRQQLAAFRAGAGDDMDIMVDLSFNFRTEGALQLARAMEPYDLMWVEIDSRDPRALRQIRDAIRIPLASCECLFGRREYRPFFEQGAVDVALIDVPFNGLAESVKIATMAEAYEINVAPHNFYSHLATMMSAHLAAIVPNLRIMETDPDQIPWKDDLVTVRPEIVDSHLRLPTGPGWGTEIDEAALRAHPARR